MAPIFTSHYSKCRSILTLDEPPDEMDVKKSISIFSIAKKYGLKEVFLADNTFTGFIEAQKNSEKLGINLRFGFKVICCQDYTKKDEESFKTEHRLIVWLKNSDAYKPAIKLYTEAATNGFYYIPRIDSKVLNSMWDNNLLLMVDSYDNFVSLNTLKGYHCIPDFGKIKPIIAYSRMGLPFDDIILEGTKKFAAANEFSLEEIHPIYYYSYADFKAYYVLRCIDKRSTFSAPKLDHLSSNKFCWEEFCKRNSLNF